jgi:hypothetical protein
VRPCSRHAATIGERFHAERGFGRRICARDESRGIDEQQAGRHVTRNGFAHALGLLRAFAFGAVQGFQFFFLLLEFLDDRLHRCGHERGGVVATRRLCGKAFL